MQEVLLSYRGLTIQLWSEEASLSMLTVHQVVKLIFARGLFNYCTISYICTWTILQVVRLIYGRGPFNYAVTAVFSAVISI